MKTRRKKQTQRQKNIFTITSGGFGTVVTNNSFKIDSKQPLLSDYFKGLSTIYIQLNHRCDTKGEGGGVILLVFVTYNPE